MINIHGQLPNSAKLQTNPVFFYIPGSNLGDNCLMVFVHNTPTLTGSTL